MSPKPVLVLAIASLVAFAATPGAAARGVTDQRVVAAVERTATTSSLIAPAANCPGQSRLDASPEAQEGAMRCMTNFARANAGLGSLADSDQLDLSARQKSDDILRCDSFSHFACDREFSYWIRQSGYTGEQCWHAGENLAWGVGEQGSVRAIFQAWMSSPTHRRNILGDYLEIGIDVARGDLEGRLNALVWTSHFGSRCELAAG
jgi:uncharacterized protein YkwD